MRDQSTAQIAGETMLEREEQLNALVAYVKSLSSARSGETPAMAAAPAVPAKDVQENQVQ